MIVLRNKSDKTLTQTGDTRESFAQVFQGIVASYGLGKNRVRLDKRKNALALELGIGSAQITRYETGSQMPSLETFVKFCIKFQIDPTEALGLIWKDSKDSRDGIVTKWRVRDDLKLGGLRLYWTCDDCNHKNIEYLDPDGMILDEIENSDTDLSYKVTKAIVYSRELSRIELMCENCGLCYIQLKDFAEWRAKNT